MCSILCSCCTRAQDAASAARTAELIALPAWGWLGAAAGSRGGHEAARPVPAGHGRAGGRLRACLSWEGRPALRAQLQRRGARERRGKQRVTSTATTSALPRPEPAGVTALLRHPSRPRTATSGAAPRRQRLPSPPRGPGPYSRRGAAASRRHPGPPPRAAPCGGTEEERPLQSRADALPGPSPPSLPAYPGPARPRRPAPAPPRAALRRRRGQRGRSVRRRRGQPRGAGTAPARRMAEGAESTAPARRMEARPESTAPARWSHAGARLRWLSCGSVRCGRASVTGCGVSVAGVVRVKRSCAEVLVL